MRKKISLSIIAIFLLVGGLVLGFSDIIMSVAKNNPDSLNGQLTEEELKNRISVVLIGADQRPGEKSFNTDTIILATVDPKNARISLLSIPRDTRVSIPGHTDIKINGVVPLTDLDNLVDVVSDLTGLPIAGYIQTNFDGFKDIIDTLGGITVDVEKDMYYETGDKKDGVINLKKGLQKLDGSKALQYARFRNDALADISRTARQQVVLKAVAEEMLKLSTLPKLPWLIPQLNQAVNTNLELRDMLKIAKTAVKFKDVEFYTQTLPGRFRDLKGLSYWEVDPDEAKKVVTNLLRGITTDKVIGDSVIDLLEPIEPNVKTPLPQVPGSPVDPNGQESTEYQGVNPNESVPGDKVKGNKEEPVEKGGDTPNKPEAGSQEGKGSRDQKEIPDDDNSNRKPGEEIKEKPGDEVGGKPAESLENKLK